MNCEGIYAPAKPEKRGRYRIGVSADNVSTAFFFTYFSAANLKAVRFTEETGIQFHVYEETTVYKPVS